MEQEEDYIQDILDFLVQNKKEAPDITHWNAHGYLKEIGIRALGDSLAFRVILAWMIVTMDKATIFAADLPELHGVLENLTGNEVLLKRAKVSLETVYGMTRKLEGNT